MNPSPPSAGAVLTQVNSLDPPGTPLTAAEIGDLLEVPSQTVETVLDDLVTEGVLETRAIDGQCRVWWRPAAPPTESRRDSDQTGSLESGLSPRAIRHLAQAVTAATPSDEQADPNWLYSVIFNRTFEFIGAVAPDGTLLEANASALEFGGCSRADVVGNSFWEAPWWQLSNRTQHRLEDAIRRAANGEVIRYEVEVKGESRTATIDFSLRPITDDGEVTLLVAEGRDISDRKEHELRLRRQRDDLESELSEILERISDGFYSLDSRFRFQYVNDHAQDLLGVEESAVRGQEIHETIETTERFRDGLRTAVESQEPVFFEDYYDPLGGWFDNAIYPSETGVSIYFRDISGRKRLEAALRTETEHFQVALQQSPVSAFRLDTDLRYTWIGNPRHGFAEADVLGKRDDELLPPEAAEALLEPKRRALETGTGVREKITYELPSGTVTDDLAVEPLYDAGGEILGLTATAVDLTESTRATEALQDSERRLRLALRAGEMGTWELDLGTEAAPAHSLQHDRIFGYEEPVEDWRLEQFLDHVHPEDREFVIRRLDAALETGSWAFECRIVRIDDAERWISVDGETQTDADGEPVCTVGIVKDITDRKRHQQALKASEQRYRTLVNNFPNGGVGLLDADLRHTVVGGLGFETLGFDVAALRGECVEDVFPAEIADVLALQYQATLGGESRSFELQVGDRSCEFRTLPLTDADGTPAVLSIFHDVTLRKRQQERELMTQIHLHEVVGDIAHLIIESPTQTDIEGVVCDRFAETDAYTTAWIGRLDRDGETVSPSAISGDGSNGGNDGNGSGIAIEIDATDPTVAGPISRAVETGESQRVHTSPTDPVYASQRASKPVDHQPGVVVPIRYGVHVYGVLVVYSDRPEAFGGRERDTLDHLGGIVGHAINSIERKQALLADRVTEVVVGSEAIAAPFIEAADGDAVRVSMDQVTILSGGRSLVYYTVAGIESERFVRMMQGFAPGSDVRLLDDSDDAQSRFELATDAETIHSVIASYGGRITEATLQDATFRLTIHVPQGTDVRQVLDAARTKYPDLSLVAQTTITPPQWTAEDAFALLADQLTDRQRQTLEVAYYAGFFEWPRESSGDDLAERLGVTPATVHHHLRHAQRKLLAAFFEEPPAPRL